MCRNVAELPNLSSRTGFQWRKVTLTAPSHELARLLFDVTVKFWWNLHQVPNLLERRPFRFLAILASNQDQRGGGKVLILGKVRVVWFVVVDGRKHQPV